jgi:hypothetical protein
LELLQRFNSLWALSFECNDAITWKDIRLLLSIPTIVEVTLAGTKIFSKVILEDASDLAHPSLESIVSGEGMFVRDFVVIADLCIRSQAIEFTSVESVNLHIT